MIVQTPELYRCGEWLNSPDNRYFFCLDSLQEFIDVPLGVRIYWGEVSSRQWKDGSGLRVKVKIDHYGHPLFQCVPGRRFCVLCDPCRKHLRELGCVPDGPAKTVYFRLLYEEE